MKARLIVVAKEPVPGRVKTRLCPPCTHHQAALIAQAALEDTVDVVSRTPATGRTLAISGTYPARAGWDSVRQRGSALGERLAYAFADAAGSAPGLLVGMDTPQLTPELLARLSSGLDGADAVLGPAKDGGWWGLALRDSRHSSVLRDIPMSTSDTARHTVLALSRLGLRVIEGPLVRDVDTAADAWAVAADCPQGRFAAAVRAHVPIPDPSR